MSNVEYLAAYHFPTDERWLASLSVRVDDLGARLGFQVLSWDDDGVGPARGFGCRILTGRVFVMVEHELSIKYSQSRGPIVFVDASEIARFGVRRLLEDFLNALNLSSADVVQAADDAVEEEAIRFVVQFEADSRNQDTRQVPEGSA